MVKKDLSKNDLHGIYIHNSHIGLTICLIVSVILLSLALIFNRYIPGELLLLISNFFNNNIVYDLFYIWYNIITYLKQYYISAITALSSAVLSGILLLLGGKNYLIILQFKTFIYVTGKKFFLLLIIIYLSPLVAIYSKTQNRITSYTLSIISFVIIMIYIVLYLIRFNNNKIFYYNEICSCIIKLVQNRDNYKKLKSFIKYLSPDIPLKHNSIIQDVDMIHYLLINTNPDNLSSIMVIINDLLIPLTAQLRRTYESDTEILLIKIIHRLKNIHTSNIQFNIYIHYYIKILLLQYVIECGNKKDHLSTERKEINSFLSGNDFHIDAYFGLVDLNTTYIEDINLEDIKTMYFKYIMNLNDMSIINMYVYKYQEIEYISKRKILRYTFENDNMIAEIDFIDILKLPV